MGTFVKKNNAALVAVLAVVCLAAMPVLADSQYYNVNFNDTPEGSQIVTAPGGSHLQSLGGYCPDQVALPNAACGTITAKNVGSMYLAADMKTNPSNAEVGALWMDTGISPAVKSQIVTMSFDLDVISGSPTAQPKGLANDPTHQTSILFGINTYAGDKWAFRFAAAATGDNGGILALRSADNNQLISFGTYSNGQVNHIDIVADYSTGQATAYLNGNLALANSPFWATGASDVVTREHFMHLNGSTTGQSNEVAIDNFAAFDYAAVGAVPEPVTMLGVIAGIGGVVGYIRKRRAA